MHITIVLSAQAIVQYNEVHTLGAVHLLCHQFGGGAGVRQFLTIADMGEGGVRQNLI